MLIPILGGFCFFMVCMVFGLIQLQSGNHSVFHPYSFLKCGHGVWIRCGRHSHSGCLLLKLGHLLLFLLQGLPKLVRKGQGSHLGEYLQVDQLLIEKLEQDIILKLSHDRRIGGTAHADHDIQVTAFGGFIPLYALIKVLSCDLDIAVLGVVLLDDLDGLVVPLAPALEEKLEIYPVLLS